MWGDYPPEMQKIVDYLKVARDLPSTSGRARSEIDSALRKINDSWTADWCKYGFLFDALEAVDPKFKQGNINRFPHGYRRGIEDVLKKMDEP